MNEIVLCFLGSLLYILGMISQKRQDKKYDLIINTDVKIDSEDGYIVVKLPTKNKEFGIEHKGKIKEYKLKKYER